MNYVTYLVLGLLLSAQFGCAQRADEVKDLSYQHQKWVRATVGIECVVSNDKEETMLRNYQPRDSAERQAVAARLRQLSGPVPGGYSLPHLQWPMRGIWKRGSCDAQAEGGKRCRYSLPLNLYFIS